MLDRVIASVLLLLFIAGNASAQAPEGGSAQPAAPGSAAFLSPEAALSAEARATDATVDRIETLRAELIQELGEARATDERANEASETNAIALREQANKKRVDALAKLTSLIAAVQELDEGESAATYRAQLGAFLPVLASQLSARIEAAEADLEALREEAKAAEADQRIVLEQRADRRSDLVGKLLAAGVELVMAIEDLEIDVSAVREQLSAGLADRSSIIASRIELLNARVADSESRLAVSPDDAAVQSALHTSREQLVDDARELSANLELMERLGLDTAEYQKLLFATTGEITTDVLDAEVVQGLLGEWMGSLRDAIVRNGPGFFFKTLLFGLIVFAFWMLARFVRKVTARAVEAPHLRFSELLKRMIVSLSSGAVLVLGLLVALSQLGIQVGPLLAGLGIAGFIVGFALQETLANFAAGVMILAYRPFDVGDLIDCAGGVFGKVSRMNLVSTTILTVDNQTKVVPNGKIWGDVITNVTAQRTRRVDLVFGISYSDDIPHAEKVMWSVVKEHPKVIADPEPVVKLHQLGDSSVNFVVRPWCARDDYWDVYWDLTREVKLRFDREGISIPFPQQDVHFHPAQHDGGSSPDAHGGSKT